MPLTDFLNASNLRVHAGEAGRIYSKTGEIWISKASLKGIDSSLWGALKHCVDVLGLGIQINSIDTGHHVKNSRHYQGRAVDINRIWNMGGPMKLAELANVEALKLVNYLLANGFGIGERKSGNVQCGIIFGPPHSKWNPTSIDHSTHLHVSVCKRRE